VKRTLERIYKITCTVSLYITLLNQHHGIPEQMALLIRGGLSVDRFQRARSTHRYARKFDSTAVKDFAIFKGFLNLRMRYGCHSR